jgi:hypothetical protein
LSPTGLVWALAEDRAAVAEEVLAKRFERANGRPSHHDTGLGPTFSPGR